jgi:CubicO group peptidase (beta-lactamase class C family)
VRITASRRSAFHSFAIALLLTASSVAARDVSIAIAKPESVGFSSERLALLDRAMQAYVDNEQIAGIATILARHGKIVHQKAYGMQDIASGTPMKMDTIVRIYSMTKPVTGVAMMMLYEEGKWKPSDPISRYIPEFKDLKVFAGMGADGKPILEAPKHAPTMAELMSHTAGFTYGYFGASPVDKMYQADHPLAKRNLQQAIERLAELPLLYQPGEAWVYSVSVDIQGHIVEKLSGKTLGQFMKERIFDPLGMKDTAFHVPKEKLGRVATIYQGGMNGLTPMPHDPNISVEPTLPQGGGGLYSTAGDYLRFAQMLANGGVLDGKRLLAPSSVELMRANVVSDEVLKSEKYGLPGFYRQRPGTGFGYDFFVVQDPLKIGSTIGKGSYLWYGIAGTWFWIDPTNDLIFISMIQRRGAVPGSPSTEELSHALVYQALVEPEK